MGRAKSNEAAIPTATINAMGLKEALGAMASTMAPTMPMMAMLEMKLPTRMVKLMTTKTKTNCEAPVAENEEIKDCNES